MLISNSLYKKENKLSVLIVRFYSNTQRTKKSLNKDLIFNILSNSLFKAISSLDTIALKLISILESSIKKSLFKRDLTKNLTRVDNI